MPYIFVRFVFFVWYAKHPPVAKITHYKSLISLILSFVRKSWTLSADLEDESKPSKTNAKGVIVYQCEKLTPPEKKTASQTSAKEMCFLAISNA